MSSPELDNLEKIGKLKREAPRRSEVEGLLRSGETRLRDAGREDLSVESRFDLAYNASHALSLAALRHHGFRSENRYVVFQALAHTAGLPSSTWRVLAKCHERRNRAEYEGIVEIDEHLLMALLNAAQEVLAAVKGLASVDDE